MNQKQRYTETVSPHTYPLWIRLSFLFCMAVVIFFSTTQLSKLKECPKRIKAGEKAFKEKDYKQAIVIFSKLLKEHPNLNQARIRLAQSHYHLGNLEIGLKYIANRTFTKGEYRKLCAHIPKYVLEIYFYNDKERRA